MIVKDGIYVGSLCSLIVKNNNIQVVVSDEQLELLSFNRNNDFHFDKDGECDGTGCCVTEECSQLGNKVYKDFFGKEENKIAYETVKELKRRLKRGIKRGT